MRIPQHFRFLLDAWEFKGEKKKKWSLQDDYMADPNFKLLTSRSFLLFLNNIENSANWLYPGQQRPIYICTQHFLLPIKELTEDISPHSRLWPLPNPPKACLPWCLLFGSSCLPSLSGHKSLLTERLFIVSSSHISHFIQHSDN